MFLVVAYRSQKVLIISKYPTLVISRIVETDPSKMYQALQIRLSDQDTRSAEMRPTGRVRNLLEVFSPDQSLAKTPARHERDSEFSEKFSFPYGTLAWSLGEENGNGAVLPAGHEVRAGAQQNHAFDPEFFEVLADLPRGGPQGA